MNRKRKHPQTVDQERIADAKEYEAQGTHRTRTEDIGFKTHSTFTVGYTVKSYPERNQRAFWNEYGTANLSNAMEFVELGSFQFLLFIVCLIAFMTSSTVPSILRESAKAIECDLQLVKEDMETINDVVYMSMIIGGVTWSLLADKFSRKWTLVFILFVYSGSVLGLAVAPTFMWFGFFRALSAFCLSGLIPTAVTLLAEFQMIFNRGAMICCLQLGWVIGILTTPVLSWVWHEKLLACIIPSVVATFGLMYFPDSPKFLLSRGREKAAIRALQIMHLVNTITNRPDFPIVHLIDDPSAAELKRRSVIKLFIPPNMKPSAVCIPILMLSQFVLMFSYFTMALWFPQMVAREEAFFPVIRFDNIPPDCKIGNYNNMKLKSTSPPLVNFSKVEDELENVTTTFKPSFPDQPPNPCSLDSNTFIYDERKRTIIAIACLPSVILIMLESDNIGRKSFLMTSHIVLGCLSFASYFLSNIGKDLIFSCVYNAFALFSIAAAHCFAVELFPTRTRVLGVALVIGSGQLGAILGDIGYAVSFGSNCVTVVSTLALLLATVLMLAVPDTTGISLK